MSGEGPSPSGRGRPAEREPVRAKPKVMPGEGSKLAAFRTLTRRFAPPSPRGRRGAPLHSSLMCELAGSVAGVSCDDVAVSDELVFVDQQTFDADRPSGVRLIRADPDLGAKAVTKSIGEAC